MLLALALLLHPLAVSAAASSDHWSAVPPHPSSALDLDTPANDITTKTKTSSSSRRAQDHPKEERYEILPSSEILARLQALVSDYPAFTTLTTTQEWFGLPRAGGESDCPFDSNYKVQGTGCNNYVLIIQDKEAYPEDPDVQLSDEADQYLKLEDGYFKKEEEKSGWKYVPDVFLSGSVHGNERVGPSSLLELSELMVEAAHCESLPRMRHKPKEEIMEGARTNKNGTSETNAQWEDELAYAQSCRQSLAERGVPAPYRQWLARLVSTRRTIVIPTANALGYSRDEREEAGIDPNRDFPFDIQPHDSNKCMQTIAGRSINELFRSHLFPIGLTFHGGMEVISYEWGAPTYLNKDAPDDIAQETIASAYSRYANGFKGHVPYDFGTMNDKVYYVRGGMEDWAFAGSWDPDRVVQCTPNTFGGYPSEKTTYNNSTLRCFNMLIETSAPKTPAREDLGKRTEPFVSTNGEANGHIARNMRLALLAVDVVEPYVSIQGVEGLEFEDDVVPGVNKRRYDGMSYFENSRIVWVPAGKDGEQPDGGGDRQRRKTNDSQNNEVKVSWTVGGSFNIDTTELVVGTWDDLPANLANDEDGTYPSKETLKLIKDKDKFLTLVPTNIDSGDIAGRSRWHSDGPYPTTSNSGIVINPSFEATIDTSNYSPGTSLAIFARAAVDKNWLEQSDNVGPKGLGPTSHIVNARHNPSYLATNAGKVIRGQKDSWWYSDPITVVVGVTYGSESEAQEQLLQEAISNDAPRSFLDEAKQQIRAVHLNARLEYLPGVMDVIAHTLDKDGKSMATTIATTKHSMPWMLGPLVVVASIVLVLVGLARWRERHVRRRFMERVAENEDDTLSVDSSYRDNPIDEANGDAEMAIR